MLAKLFSPAGRINRGTYWLLSLLPAVYFIFSFVVAIAPTLGGQPSGASGLGLLLLLVGLPVSIWFSFCTICKRYHDLGKSGWWYLFVFIPIIGPIWQFIELGFVAGDEGDNDYGPPGGRMSNAEINAAAAPGQLALKDIDFSKYRNIAAQPVSARVPTAAATAGKPVFGKRV